MVSALVMQLIMLFCGLKQQPTCIKNIKSITAAASPIKNIRLKFESLMCAKGRLQYSGGSQPYIRSDQHHSDYGRTKMDYFKNSHHGSFLITTDAGLADHPQA